jgi:hypothetical protein
LRLEALGHLLRDLPLAIASESRLDVSQEVGRRSASPGTQFGKPPFATVDPLEQLVI